MWLVFIPEIKTRSLFDRKLIDEEITVHSLMFYWTGAVRTVKGNWKNYIVLFYYITFSKKYIQN
jgi:hypothetical protein